MSFDYVRFGSLFSSPQKNGLTRAKKVRGAGLPMVNMGELFAHPRIKNLPMDLVPLSDAEHSFVLEPGDLLFARQSLVLEGAGQCSIFLGGLERTVFESHLIRCRLDRSAANAEFYFYFFQSPEGRRAIEAIAEQGAGASGIRGSDLVNVLVPHPSRPWQDEAASVLATVDDRIAFLRETNATLEAIAQALFKSWFVDFDPVRARQQGRAPVGMDEATAALLPESFKDSAWGLQPTGWSARAVEELSERIGMGPFGSNIKVSTFVDQGVPVLNGANVQGALLEDGGFRFITSAHAERLGTSCVRAGDIVITHRGTLGQVALVSGHSKFDTYVLSQSQFFLRCDLRVMQPEWMLYFLRSPAGQHLLLANASQVGVPSIARPSTYLRSIRLVVPPIQLVNRFAEVARAIHAAIMGNRELAQTLTTLRDTLLPRLISGRLRIHDAEARVADAIA